MAGEDFNIRLGLDTSAADNALKEFTARAKRQTAALKAELGEIKAPKIQLDVDTQNIVDKMAKLEKRILTIKSSFGDSSKNAGAPVKYSGTKGMFKKLEEYENRISAIKGSIDQMSSLKAKQGDKADPKLDLAIEHSRKLISQLEKEKQTVAKSIAAQGAQLETYQKEYNQLMRDPKVVEALKKRKEAVEKANQGAVEAEKKRRQILDEIARIEKGPEYHNMLLDRKNILEEMRRRYGQEAQNIRTRLASLKAQFSSSKDPSEKLDIGKTISVATARITKITGFMSELTEQIGEIEDSFESNSSFIASEKDKLRNTVTYKDNRELSSTDSGGTHRAPWGMGSSLDEGKQRAQLRNIVADIVEDIVKSSTNPKTGEINTKPFDMGSLVLEVLKRVRPGFTGQSQVAVVLRDATQSQVEDLVNAFVAAEEQGDEEEADAIKEILENSGLSDDAITEALRAKKRSTAVSSSFGTQQEMISSGSGSIVPPDVDTLAAINEANRETKEIVQILFGGLKSTFPKGRVKVKTIGADGVAGIEGKVEIVGADQLEMAVEAAALIFQELNKTLGGVFLSTASKPKNLYSSSLKEEKEDESVVGEEPAYQKRNQDLKLNPEKEIEETRKLRAALNALLSSQLTDYAKKNPDKADLVKSVKDAISRITIREFRSPLGGPNLYSSDPNSDKGLILRALNKFTDALNPAGEPKLSGNVGKIESVLGQSVMSNVLKELISLVTKGVNNPEKVFKGLDEESDTAQFEYQVLGSTDSLLKFHEIISRLNPTAQALLETLQLQSLLFDKDVKVKNAMSNPTKPGSNVDIIGNPKGTESNPVMEALLQMFNASGSNQYGFLNVSESEAPIVTALKDLATTFQKIYGITLKAAITPDANGKLPQGLVSDIGVPSGPSPDATVMTYIKAFSMNRQKYFAELLQAGAGKTDTGKKDASDKAGGAEISLDRVEGILERLDVVPEMTSGVIDLREAILGLTAVLSSGKITDLSPQIVAQAKDSIAKTLDVNSRMTGFGIRSVPGIPENDKITKKYLGKDTASGVIKEIEQSKPQAEQAGGGLADSVIEGYEKKMEIESPSKRMRRSGKQTVDGLEEGLFEGTAVLDKAGRELADSFHEGWSEAEKVKAVQLIQQLKKEGTPEAEARIQKGMAMFRSAPDRSAQVSKQEEIAKRNAEVLKNLEEAARTSKDLLVALDVESTGAQPGSGRDKVFGYSVVAGAGVESMVEGPQRQTVVRPNLIGIGHGMLVPPADPSTGQYFNPGSAKAIGLQQGMSDNFRALPNLIKRIESLGYGEKNTKGSEEEYVNQLEDIAFILTQLYEKKIPLAIHQGGLSDLTKLGKEFAKYGITAPTAKQFRDESLLVETESMTKMFFAGVSKKLGETYKWLTGMVMGEELTPKRGSKPTLTSAEAKAHDPTIDTAATLVNAFSMRQAASDSGVERKGIAGRTLSLVEAGWNKISDAIWGFRKFDQKTPLPENAKMWQRQTSVEPPHTMQPEYIPGSGAARPATPASPTPPSQDAAQQALAVQMEYDKKLQEVEMWKANLQARRKKAEFQYEVDKVEELKSRLLLLQAQRDQAVKSGAMQPKQLLDDIVKVQKQIDEALFNRDDVADALAKQIEANGGVREQFFAQKKKIKPIPEQIQLEKDLKALAEQLGIQQVEVQKKASSGGRGAVLAAPLEQLRAAEARLQKALESASVGNVAPVLVKKIKDQLKEVQQSIAAGPVGSRRMRDASGALTSAEVDVYKVSDKARGIKDRVSGKSYLETVKRKLAKEIADAEEKGRQDVVDELTKLVDQIDSSIAQGPVGKFNNGRMAYEVPDAVRRRQEFKNVRISNVEGTNTLGLEGIHHQAQIDQARERAKLERSQASKALEGQMKNEMAIMKQVEAYNRKMMDSWISGRYALYDVANTYQQFNQVLRRVVTEFRQAIDVFAQYETAFTSVERSMQPLKDEFAGMRYELVKLTGELPIAFDELAKIQTLGAQMGIKADGITNFTEQVSKFSTITGIASDTVAQKFGRISQLANVPSEDFNKLGSAVAYAGVNAVATDIEILTLTENIAAAAENSGFAAQEIIGLATAMSSLGIAPEQARGVITRLFGDINRAVEGGGKPLQAFAERLGLSAESTKELWKADPQGFFKKLLESLSKSKNLTVALDALNIKETREISTLQKLSENLDVYNQAMADAEESYKNGTFLGDSYAKTQDNIATKMQLVSNQFKMFQDAFGVALSGPVGVLLDMVKGILEYFNKIAANPAGQWAMRVATAITAIVSVMTLARMASMKATASLLAFRTAQMSLSKIGGQESGIMAFAKALFGAEQLIVRSNGRIEVSTRKAIKAMEAAGELEIVPEGSDLEKTFLSRKDARRSGMASEADFDAELNAMKQATLTSNEDTLATIGNTNAKKQNALQRLFSRKATREETTAVNSATQAENLNTVATKAGTVAGREQVAVIKMGTVATRAFGRGMMVASTALGVFAIASTVFSMIQTHLDSMKVDLEEAGGGLASFREAIYKDTQAFRDGGEAFSTYSSKITTSKTGIADWAEGLQTATEANGPLTEAVSETTDEVEYQTLALHKNSQEWLANAAMQDDVIQGMFKKYFERQQDLGQFAEQAGVKISDILKAALTKPGTGAVEFLQKSFDALSLPPGLSSEIFNDLMNIAKALDSTTLAGVENSKVITALMGTFETIDETGAAAAIEDVAKKVYTLTNYVSDLSSLMSSAFAVRYGLEESTDKLANSWSAVTDRFEQARKQLEGINREISSITADRNILEYQLSVALRYGDTMRADKLRAEITAKTAEIQDKQLEAQKAAEQSSTGLVGMNPGAIQNRETMRSMVQDYQGHLAALANQYSKYTGETQKADRQRILDQVKTLKSDFKTRAMALGFSETELQPYLDSFKDWKKIVEKLPNQLTVKVVADPGMRAWIEWWAANKDNNGVTSIVSSNQTSGAGSTDPNKKPKPTPGAPEKKIGELALNASESSLTEKKTQAEKAYTERFASALKELKGKDYAPSENDLFRAMRSPKEYQEIYGKLGGPQKKKFKRIIDELKQLQANEGMYASIGSIQESVAGKAAEEELRNALSSELQYALKLVEMPNGAMYSSWSAQQYNLDKKKLEELKGQYDTAVRNEGLDPNQVKFEDLNSNAKARVQKYYDNLQAQRNLIFTRRNQANKSRDKLLGFKKQDWWASAGLDILWGRSEGDPLKWNHYASGGYVSGPGTARSDSITARLSNGEYVQNAKAVKYYGLDFMNALNTLQVQRMPLNYGNMGQSTNGKMVVELSSSALMQLMSLANRPINLYSDDRQIASSANRGNMLLAMRGAN